MSDYFPKLFEIFSDNCIIDFAVSNITYIQAATGPSVRAIRAIVRTDISELCGYYDRFVFSEIRANYFYAKTVMVKYE